MPRVSVILPAHNAMAYLREAAESILEQTFRDFELIVMDDGSTDATGEIADSVAAADDRVRVIHQSNQRIVATLNRGCELARGEIIAIMHGDDVALPTRLARQLSFLDAHPDIAICGTWIETFRDVDGTRMTGRSWEYPSDPDFVACFLLFWCCVAHPTIMLRASVFREGMRYDQAYNYAAEDYGLWAACVAKGYRIGNVPEVLLRYREHAGQGSQTFKTQQREETRMIRLSMLRRMGLSPTVRQLDMHQKLAESELEPTAEFVAEADAWLREIFAANQRGNMLPCLPLAKVLAGRWAAVCLAAKSSPESAEIWRRFWASPLAEFVDFSAGKNRDIPRGAAG